MMNEIFHDMSDVCVVYIDDLMIFTTMDNQEEHDKIVLKVYVIMTYLSNPRSVTSESQKSTSSE